MMGGGMHFGKCPACKVRTYLHDGPGICDLCVDALVEEAVSGERTPVTEEGEKQIEKLLQTDGDNQ